MGYNLYITRRNEWSDESSGPPVTLAEFERLVLEDSLLSADPENGPGYALWGVAPAHAEVDQRVPLYWDDGQIVTKNPTSEFVDVMIAIARRIGARVQGDEGEWYD